jgi:hypothetical protein
MPANTTFVAGAILTAAQMNNLPWGVVQATAGGTSGRGFVTRLSGDISLTTTRADLTGLTVTFTPVTGRLYRATFNGYISNVGTAQNVNIAITDGSNVYKQTVNQWVIASQNAIVTASVILSGLSGSTTLKVRGAVGTTGGALVAASTGNEAAAVFVVEDIGPSA